MGFDRTRHVVNLSEAGSWSTSGQFSSDGAQVNALFARLPRDRPLALLIHGGLVSEAQALAGRVDVVGPRCLQAGLYPVFLVWETGPAEVARQVLGDLFRRPVVQALGQRIRRTEGGAGGPRGLVPHALASDAAEEEALLEAIEADEEARRSLEGLVPGEDSPALRGPHGLVPVPALISALLLGAASVAVGVVAARVEARRRDPLQWNGFGDTTLEEIVRLLYGGSLARIGWERIKRNATEAWRPSRDGWHVVEHLRKHLASGGRVSVVAHSAGACHAGALLDALAGRVPSGAVFDQLVFVAPACDLASFGSTVTRHADRVRRFSLFVLQREVEDASHMIPGVYQGSLLNVISGLLEERPGWPVAGLDRFHGSAALQEVLERSGQVHVRSPTKDGAVIAARATEHGGFDLEPATWDSILRLLTEPSPTT